MYLKPCPFCGKPAQTRVIPHDDMITVKVFCSGSCRAEQHDTVEEFCSFDTITRAMANAECAWNRRV